MTDPITDLALDVAERMLAANVNVHGRGYPPGASTMALLEGVAAVPPEHSVRFVAAVAECAAGVGAALATTAGELTQRTPEDVCRLAGVGYRPITTEEDA